MYSQFIGKQSMHLIVSEYCLKQILLLYACIATVPSPTNVTTGLGGGGKKIWQQ